MSVLTLTFLLLFTPTERDYLARLLWLEVRGMGAQREAAGLSVLDTVQGRVEAGVMGYDVFSVLRWHSGDVWQFPPAATYECWEVPTGAACPSEIEDLSWAYRLIDAYENGARDGCPGHLYYDSLPNGPQVCALWADTGQMVEWHDGW